MRFEDTRLPDRDGIREAFEWLANFNQARSADQRAYETDIVAEAVGAYVDTESQAGRTPDATAIKAALLSAVHNPDSSRPEESMQAIAQAFGQDSLQMLAGMQQKIGQDPDAMAQTLEAREQRVILASTLMATETLSRLQADDGNVAAYKSRLQMVEKIVEPLRQESPELMQRLDQSKSRAMETLKRLEVGPGPQPGA